MQTFDQYSTTYEAVIPVAADTVEEAIEKAQLQGLLENEFYEIEASTPYFIGEAPEKMNVQALQRLRDTLRNLPTTYTFDMRRGIEDTEDCGTVCCIAGLAALLGGYTFKCTGEEENWSIVRDFALAALGLTNDGHYLGHELFGTEETPKNCTPDQAADAVDRVLLGLTPWPQ